MVDILIRALEFNARGDATEENVQKKIINGEVEILKIVCCRPAIVEYYTLQTNALRTLKCLRLEDGNLSVAGILRQKNLEHLAITFKKRGFLQPGIHLLKKLSFLKYIAIRNVHNIFPPDIVELATLEGLNHLELELSCQITNVFALGAFPKFQHLTHLRLETFWSIVNYADVVLDGLRTLIHLEHLELVNFVIRREFANKLAVCYHLRKLLIAPKIVGSGLAAYNIISLALEKSSKSIKQVTWVMDNNMMTKIQETYPEIKASLKELLSEVVRRVPKMMIHFVFMNPRQISKAVFID